VVSGGPRRWEPRRSTLLFLFASVDLTRLGTERSGRNDHRSKGLEEGRGGEGRGAEGSQSSEGGSFQRDGRWAGAEREQQAAREEKRGGSSSL
jgi:hypothetical protein